MARIPIWVRVPVIIVVVLVGVIVSSAAVDLGDLVGGGEHGSSGGVEMTDEDGSTGGHGSGGSGMDHSGGDRGPGDGSEHER